MKLITINIVFIILAILVKIIDLILFNKLSNYQDQFLYQLKDLIGQKVYLLISNFI